MKYCIKPLPESLLGSRALCMPGGGTVALQTSPRGAASRIPIELRHKTQTHEQMLMQGTERKSILRKLAHSKIRAG